MKETKMDEKRKRQKKKNRKKRKDFVNVDYIDHVSLVRFML